jgi:hypothetical protein
MFSKIKKTHILSTLLLASLSGIPIYGAQMSKQEEKKLTQQSSGSQDNKQKSSNDHASVATSLANIARINHQERNAQQQALSRYIEALSIQKKILSTEHSEAPTILSQINSASEAQTQNDEPSSEPQKVDALGLQSTNAINNNDAHQQQNYQAIDQSSQDQQAAPLNDPVVLGNDEKKSENAFPSTK